MFQAFANRNYPSGQSGIGWQNWPALFKRKSVSAHLRGNAVFAVDEKPEAKAINLGIFSPPDNVSENNINKDASAVTSRSQSNQEQSEPEEKEEGLKKIAAVRTVVADGLEEIYTSLSGMGQNTSPFFVQVGLDLQAIFRDTKKLTDNVRQFAQQLNSEHEEDGSLGGIMHLIENVAEGLQKDQHEIEYDLQQITSLLTHITKVRQVYELIDGISSSFRVIRINIQIQCNTNAIGGDLFQGLADDITSLSQRLDKIAKKITRDLFASERNITTLNKSVSDNLLKIEEVSGKAESRIVNAFGEIERLIQGVALMVNKVGEKSLGISKSVSEVVVGLQFHDSMSQRLAAIEQRINQVWQLFNDKETYGEALCSGHLGTAYMILKVQLDQLDRLIEEIRNVKESIESSFEVLEEDVRQLESFLGIIQMNDDEQQNLQSQSTLLQKNFASLFDLFNQGRMLKGRIHSSTAKTREVADQLVVFSGEMKEINDDTKLQAVNTIIIASSLGDNGRTIEVLAKEISSLSDQTSLLTDDVTVLQDAILSLMEKFDDSASEKEREAIDITSLEKELEQFNTLYSEIDGHVTGATQQINTTCEQIRSIRSTLGFIDKMEEDLVSCAKLLKLETERLQTWKGEAIQVERKIPWLEAAKEEIIMHESSISGIGNGEEDESLLFVDDDSETDRGNFRSESAENIEFFG